MNENFKIGDKVSWVSMSGGKRRYKVGTIINIAHPFHNPFYINGFYASYKFRYDLRMLSDYARHNLEQYNKSYINCEHTMFLIEVPNNRKTKPLLYFKTSPLTIALDSEKLGIWNIDKAFPTGEKYHEIVAGTKQIRFKTTIHRVTGK